MTELRIPISCHPTAGMSCGREIVKAGELLAARGIVRKLRSLELPAMLTDLYYRQLLTLQAAIFALDYFGEENWSIDPVILRDRWAKIEAAAACFNGDAAAGLQMIRTYQSFEMNMRRGKPVATIPIQRFYNFKPCDVYLMEDLLMKIGLRERVHKPIACGSHVLNVLDEIRDDLDDLEEDVFTFNGNRLSSMCSMYGWKETVGEYSYFISKIIQCAREKFVLNRGEGGQAFWKGIIEAGTSLINELNSRDTLELLRFTQSRLSRSATPHLTA